MTKKIKKLFHTLMIRVLFQSPKRLMSLLLLSPKVQQFLWAILYEYTAQNIQDDDFVFLNLGYAELDQVPREDSLSNIKALSEQLYGKVVGNAPVQGKLLLEVGCCRGGGSAFVMKTFQPDSIVAVDVSENAIERCSERFGNIDGLSYQQADAMALPFEEDEFDVVLNVESSHCYPSRKVFFEQVSKTLRPGGLFLYTDLFRPFEEKLDEQKMQQMFKDAGFKVVNSADITPNVYESRKIASQSSAYEEALRRWVDVPELNKLNIDFYQKLKEGRQLEGSWAYYALNVGYLKYWCWMLQKI